MESYFHPHYFQDIILLVFLLLIWDIAGWGVIRTFKQKPPAFFRSAYWLIGLGLTVLAFFISHFIIPFQGPVFLSSAVIFSLPWIKAYLREHPFKGLLKYIKSMSLFIFLWLPLLPVIFVKTSLPPYAWDEAVYHYISPQVLTHQSVWRFHGLYQNLPRLLETAFIGLFSLTRTYATARALHFLIYFSFQVTLYSYLKSKFSKSIAAFTCLVMNFLLPHLAFEATLGYIDIGTTSLILLVWLLAIESFTDSMISPELLFIYSGLALGAKYNALPAIAASGMVYLTSLYSRHIGFRLRKIPLYTALVSLFGGYWYLKNWLVTGNPIYPFFFTCREGGCGQGQSFFDWATPMGWRNFIQIISKFFYGMPYTGWVVSGLIIAGILFGKKKYRPFILVSITLFIAEYITVSLFAGFNLRYFYHWQILLWLVCILSAVGLFSRMISLLPRKFTGLIFTVAFVLMFFLSLKILLPEYKSFFRGGDKYYQTRFAFGLVPLSDWLQWLLPRTGPAILWCEQQNRPLTLTVKDPDLNWTSGESKFPIYLTNCRHREDFDPAQPEKLLISRQNCPDASSPPPSNPGDDEKISLLRKENYQLVCSGREIVPGLYLIK